MNKSSIRDIYGLTPAQEGIYVQHFQSNDAKTYHFHSLFKINKEIDADLIKKSAELLFLRHQALKTAFTVLKSTGAIKQVILENRQPEFVVQTFDEPFSQKILDRIVAESSEKPLDLQRESLLKFTIINFSDECFMLIRSHHIILDGWCFPIIVKDLQQYYEELSKGVSVEALSERIRKETSDETSFAQYVKWLKNQDKTESSEYWKRLLEGYSYSHIFSKENKDNTQNKDVFTFRIYIDEETSQNIENYAKENKVSNNAVFEAAFGIALQKFSGKDDVVFDKVVSGRSIPLKGIYNTIGLFVNTVPFRSRSDDNSTLADLLKEAQKQTVEANKHGILSLSEIYKKCDINGRLIDALFAFENYYVGDILNDMKKGMLFPEHIFLNEQTEFNLAVAVFKENGKYAIRFSYDRQLYTETEIDNFVCGYLHILKSSLDSAKRITDIFVTDTNLFNKFNGTYYKYSVSKNATLYSLFENTAKENREKVCIKTAEKALTYGELLNISEKLDANIRSITQEKSVIAVIAERSTEMYGAIYGIIRGGNAYLPIDPDYPQDRIDYILQNSGAKAVVAQGKFTDKASDIPCIDMTEIINKLTDNHTDIPSCNAEPDDTAYVIYTSGSTGTPKGAKVSHRSAVNRILWMHDKYPLSENDVILQKTPYTFDVSVWELFWWGMCGGCLAVSKPGEHFLPAKILDEVARNKVTHLHFVPSVFEMFLNYLESHSKEVSKFDSVRYVFLSGEALTAGLVERFYKLYDYNKVTLHNLYGPTECAVDVTYYDCTPEDADPVPIGKPIYNTQIHILDKYLKPVPIGVTGELCIAGMNVGQGYLNNPELTAEKFIDNPFGEGKMYRTGDNAYWREDGNIVFCGRKDSQIKLNGQRIETGEIESVISSLPEVQAVAVLVKEINKRDTLVAFYSGEKDIEPKIKEYCRDKLPKYMIPTFVVHLDKMPLNPNGKLDRRTLSKYKIESAKSADKEPAANETERVICEAFSSVLGEKDIHRNTDFFDAGGTSLSMISVLGESIFENVSAAEFMRNPTPALLTSLLKEKSVNKAEYIEALYVSETAKQVLVLIPFAGGGAEAYSNLVASLKKTRSDISVYFIRYLHSIKECENAANEVAEIFKESEIMFYSHCVGSAVALQIIAHLEKKNVSIKHYFAGASIPPVKVSNRNSWNLVPDIALKHILLKAGADFNGLSNKALSDFFKRFRADTSFARKAFLKSDKRLKTPASVIMSKNDRFTKNYAQAEKLWSNYFEKIIRVDFISSETHYFQKHAADKLIELIVKSI